MTFDIVPGNALGCRTNAHRHGWDGSICEDAAEWACGIEADFRAKYCASETPRCFHLHLFDEDEPCLVIPDSGVGWLLGPNPTAFDDQILLIWAPQAEEPDGMVGGRPVGSYMAGAYRIEGVERVEQRNHIEWKVHPYDDGWTYMGCLEAQAPRFIHLGGPYIKQVERTSVAPIFAAAMKAGAEVTEYWTQDEKDRLECFATNLEEWQKIAEEKATALVGTDPPKPRTARERPAKKAPAAKGKVEVAEHELVTRLIPSPPKAPAVEPPDRFPIVEASKKEHIDSVYGNSTLKAIQAASLTHPLLVLRGAPGVGKSRLALDFIDDDERERSLVVPVSASWHGREDLLGVLNTTTGRFEPTAFTNFLRAAELAWRSGDFATRIVVFENFDLSPPENWLSEVLVRAQYPAASLRDRTIDLGGEAVRGWQATAGARLFLSPAVRFVATVDDPVRSGTLTSRLLDDTAVVRLTIQPKHAIKQSGLSLTPKQVEAIAQLDACTRNLGAGFSFTTAHSISACLEHLDELGVDSWKAIDLVLCQEVLSKLDLLDPGEVAEERGRQLIEWSESAGKKLTLCAERLQAWGEKVSRSGVFQS